MAGLYALLDLDALGANGLGWREQASALLSRRPAVLQLRAKSASSRETLGLLRALAPLCRRAGTRLFANDRPDLAVLGGCDGVHVGQEDLPVSEVRRAAPGLLVGVSTHNQAELCRALAERPDYVAFGPVFATASKRGAEAALGLAELARAHARARLARIPLVAIGGVDLARARLVRPHAELVAMIGALLPSDGEGRSRHDARLRALVAALGGGAARPGAASALARL